MVDYPSVLRPDERMHPDLYTAHDLIKAVMNAVPSLIIVDLEWPAMGWRSSAKRSLLPPLSGASLDNTLVPTYTESSDLGGVQKCFDEDYDPLDGIY